MIKKDPFPRFWIYIGLSVLAIVTYSNGLGNGFTSDDSSLFSLSNALHSWSYVGSQKLYFLQPLIYITIFKIFGPIAFFYRLISLLFHVGSVNLIFLITANLLSPGVGILAASLFAVHPLLVESVTWISGGPYAWSTSFFLLSFYLYIHPRSSKKLFYGISIIAYFLSLSVGITATSLVAIFVLYEYLFGNIKQKWSKIVPYAFLSGVYAVIALSGLGARIDTFQNVNAWEIPSYSVLHIPFIISKYLELYLFPIEISHYQTDVLGNLMRPIVFLCFISLYIYMFKKNKHIFFGLSVFLISLLPSLVPIGVHWLVADRYAYAGVFGLVYVTGYLFYVLSKKKGFKEISYVIFSIILLLFFIRSVLRNADWKSDFTLWKATVKSSPEDAKGHNNLANEYINQGNYQQALNELKIALELNPTYSDAYHNVGHAYSRAGQPKEAEKYYNLALKYNPKQWQSYHNLALLYYERKDYKTGAAYIKKAIDSHPNYAVLYADLGVMYFYDGSMEDANRAFLHALKLDPTNKVAQAGYAETIK